MLASLSSHGGNPPRRHAASLEEAYRDLPWIRSVVGRIGDSVGLQRWHLDRAVGEKARRREIVRSIQREELGTKRLEAIEVLRRDGDLEPVSRHPLLELLHDGNPALTGFDQRRLTAIYGDLVGECYWVLDRRPSGIPWRAWVVPSSWSKEFPTASRPTWIFRYRSWSAEISAEDVLRHVNPDPANPYGRGTGIAQSLADELGADENAAKHIARWFFRNARPDLIVSGEGMLGKKKDDPNVKRLEVSWLQKARAFKPIFFPGKIDVQAVGHTFDQQQLVPLRASLRDIVVQTHGYPPELLGILGDSNRSTIGLAQELHAKHNTLPRLIRMQETVERLLPEYRGVAENAVLSFSNPVERDQEFALKAARAQPHALTMKEWRDLSGHAPRDGDDVHLVANRFTAYTRLEDVELLTAKPPDGEEAEEQRQRMVELEEAIEDLQGAA